MGKREYTYCDGCGKKKGAEDTWYYVIPKNSLESGSIVIRHELHGPTERFDRLDFCSKKCAISWLEEVLSYEN